MELTPVTYLIVLPLVFLAGFVDSVAGGGGIISLPAYLMAGIPAHLAAGTNKVVNGTGTLVAALKYFRSGKVLLRPAVTAAGIERAEIIAGDAARESGDRQRPKHLPVQDPHHGGGGAGGQVARLGAAARGDEVEREQRREAEDHKGTGARADQPVVAAEHQSDEGGAQQLLPRRIDGTLLGGNVPPKVLP